MKISADFTNFASLIFDLADRSGGKKKFTELLFTLCMAKIIEALFEACEPPDQDTVIKWAQSADCKLLRQPPRNERK
jgi:hypothetical protein